MCISWWIKTLIISRCTVRMWKKWICWLFIYFWYLQFTSKPTIPLQRETVLHLVDRQFSMPQGDKISSTSCISCVGCHKPVSMYSRFKTDIPIYWYPYLLISLSTDVPIYWYSYLLISISTDIPIYWYPYLLISLSTDIPIYWYPYLLISISTDILIYWYP